MPNINHIFKMKVKSYFFKGKVKYSKIAGYIFSSLSSFSAKLNTKMIWLLNTFHSR